MMDVNQFNASVFVYGNVTEMTTPASYLAAGCSASKNGSCGNAQGLIGYETSFNETISLYFLCLGQPEWNITLELSATYLRNYTLPAISEDDDSTPKRLSEGGIAGIVVACVVAFLFIVGLVFSLRGTLWFKNLWKCCRNKT